MLEQQYRRLFPHSPRFLTLMVEREPGVMPRPVPSPKGEA